MVYGAQKHCRSVGRGAAFCCNFARSLHAAGRRGKQPLIAYDLDPMANKVKLRLPVKPLAKQRRKRHNAMGPMCAICNEIRNKPSFLCCRFPEDMPVSTTNYSAFLDALHSHFHDPDPFNRCVAFVEFTKTKLLVIESPNWKHNGPTSVRDTRISYCRTKGKASRRHSRNKKRVAMSIIVATFLLNIIAKWGIYWLFIL